MDEPFPSTRLEHEFNRMFQRVPKPEAPVPMDTDGNKLKDENDA